MLEIGKYNNLEIVKRVDFGLYLKSDQLEILLPNKFVPENINIGDILRVFIYKDSEDRVIATTQEPYAEVGQFAALKVKEVNNLGAFLDWGLDKDLLVPFSEQHKRMSPGKKYVIRVTLDPKTNRIIGVNRLSTFLTKDTSDLEEGQEVDLIVYEETDLGWMAIIDNTYKGILYKNELFKNLEVGDNLKGYIKKVREDNKVDLTLNKFGYNEVLASKEKILEKLKENNGVLNVSDESSPEVIKENFQMSKKVFKKVLGALFKEGKILLKEGKIELK